MKLKTVNISIAGLMLIMLSGATQHAIAYGYLGEEVDIACEELGYPLAPQHFPRMADNCDSCHDNNVSGPGEGRDAYLNWKFADGNLDYFCPPPQDAPDIKLVPSQISFGIVEVGTTVTNTAIVENIGTQVLNVSSIAPCRKTSFEYSTSPSSLSVAPGGSQTITVIYSPVDENTDTGCVEVISNDPDESVATFDVSGTGYVFLPQMLDLDIERFRISSRVNLKNTKQVTATLVVTNTGTSYGSATATLAGTLDGTPIYDEVIIVSAEAGRSARFDFPGFTPTEIGNIQWQVTVADEDPDVDTATAITRVVR